MATQLRISSNPCVNVVFLEGPSILLHDLSTRTPAVFDSSSQVVHRVPPKAAVQLRHTVWSALVVSSIARDSPRHAEPVRKICTCGIQVLGWSSALRLFCSSFATSTFACFRTDVKVCEFIELHLVWKRYKMTAHAFTSVHSSLPDST
jgi:hypothetical protein